jgi:hypothetical protein
MEYHRNLRFLDNGSMTTLTLNIKAIWSMTSSSYPHDVSPGVAKLADENTFLSVRYWNGVVDVLFVIMDPCLRA